MVVFQEFGDGRGNGLSELSVLENGMDKICVVHSFMGYIFIARYRAIPPSNVWTDFCHHYQITFEKGGVTYSIGEYPISTTCKEVGYDEFMLYLESDWPEDVGWLLFHPELYSGRFDPDV